MTAIFHSGEGSSAAFFQGCLHMALASQAPRSGQLRASSNLTTGKPGNGPKIAIAVTVVAVIGLSALFLWSRSGSKTPAGDGTTSPAGANTASDKGSGTGSGTKTAAGGTGAAVVQKPVEPPFVPTKITMGQPTTGALVPPPANEQTNPATAPGSMPTTVPGAPASTATNPAPAGGTPGNSAGNNSGSSTGSTPGTTPGNGSGAATVTPTAVIESSAPAREVRDVVDSASRAISAGRLVEGRTLLNRALMNPALASGERNALRSQIASLNETLFFGSAVAAGDAITDSYTIAAGDSLVTIVSKQGIPVEWQLIARINKVNPSALKIGQKIKVVRQPLHAIVHKSEYRMDVYAGDPLAPGSTTQTGPDGQDPSWTYIRSFMVGLGESGGTPEGAFVIKPKSKLINPRWVNPRDSKQKFDGGDPKNPIGKHWMGLEGTDEVTRKFTSYGIHGTIDPASIGKQMSMGCIRMLPDDVAMVYEMLKDKISTVKIVK